MPNKKYTNKKNYIYDIKSSIRSLRSNSPRRTTSLQISAEGIFVSVYQTRITDFTEYNCVSICETNKAFHVKHVKFHRYTFIT